MIDLSDSLDKTLDTCALESWLEKHFVVAPSKKFVEAKIKLIDLFCCEFVEKHY